MKQRGYLESHILMPDTSNIVQKKRQRMNRIKQMRGINASEANLYSNYSVEPTLRGEGKDDFE